jgi:hypothetical protein
MDIDRGTSLMPSPSVTTPRMYVCDWLVSLKLGGRTTGRLSRRQRMWVHSIRSSILSYVATQYYGCIVARTRQNMLGLAVLKKRHETRGTVRTRVAVEILHDTEVGKHRERSLYN